MLKETLERLIKNYTGNDLAGYVINLIEEERKLLEKKRVLQVMSLGEKKRHEKEMEDIKKEFAEFRKICPHHETTFYGDPSGGNDSETICDICGDSV